MKPYANDIGVLVPQLLLPRKGTDFSKWAVVACDQFTSQPEYWQEAAALVADAPSTLKLIFPEAYLGKEGEDARIAAVQATMEEYLANGVLEALDTGFVLVKRETNGKIRTGLMMALDLEEYDYNKGATTLIRATEGTVLSRIPPRLRIRQGAKVEIPHILVLIDDPMLTVIEPLAAKADALPLLYDTELMLGGGHVEGRLVSEPSMIKGVLSSLAALKDPIAFKEKYGPKAAPLLFAMGDGNHSFATAKAAWEAIKSTLPKAEWEDCPARYALVEVGNVHDAGIMFEPIHRVLFGVEPEKAIETIRVLLSEQNGDCALMGPGAAHDENDFSIPYFIGGREGTVLIKTPTQQLAVGALQTALDAFTATVPGSEVDYIHGADVTRALAQRQDAIGFLLPNMKKEDLFPTVVYDGALPRKTFSMGEASEKRYYMELRKILG